MAVLNVTEGQYRTAKQSLQNRYIKLELLNYQYQTVDELSGVCINGSLSIDANADVRRTGSVELVVQDSTFDVQSGGKIWLDKYIRVWVGTENLLTGEVEWVNTGMYIIDAPSYNYDRDTNTLTLSLLDLMAKLTGVRNGYVKGIPVTYEVGENIRNAIIATIALGGFTRYVVEEAPSPGVIPNSIDFQQGSTLYEMLSGLRDIYPNYEMYFDVDGVFIYKPIPTGQNEPIMARDDLWENIVLSEELNVNFQNVKNSVEVYGRIHEPAYYASSVAVAGNVLTLTVAGVSAYKDGVIYGFVLTNPTTKTNMSLGIGSLGTLPVLNDDGSYATMQAEQGEVYYCVQYMGSSNTWRWLGHLQAYGFAEDTNPQSPFYVEGTVGRIRLPLYDGDYADCMTDDLAQQRAEYELWLHTNMNNTMQINYVPVFFLDVNNVVQYTSARSGETDLYIIKSIRLDLSPTGQASLEMIKYYPAYAPIINERS